MTEHLNVAYRNLRDRFAQHRCTATGEVVPVHTHTVRGAGADEEEEEVRRGLGREGGGGEAYPRFRWYMRSLGLT